jgi:hypothetical protein
MILFTSNIDESGYRYRTRVFLQDDFLTGAASSGSIGVLGWGSSGTVTTQAGVADLPGLYRFDTGAVSATNARLNFATSSAFVASELHRITWITRLNTNDANTTVRYGAGNSVALSPPANGIYFEKLDGDTNWFCVTRAAAAETRTNSGIAVDTGFHTFYYERYAASVRFWIDGVLVAENVLTLPTGAVSPFAFIINSAAAAKTFDVDYFQLHVFDLSRI